MSESLESNITECFININNSLLFLKMQITQLQKVVKTLEKDVKKDVKKNKKPVKLTSKREPSGFAKPTKISKELCEFINKPEGFEIARTEVTKILINYIKENNLLEIGNKIVPDDKLIKLLGVKEEELSNLNYFNIQKYMNKHFYSKNNLI